METSTEKMKFGMELRTSKYICQLKYIFRIPSSPGAIASVSKERLHPEYRFLTRNQDVKIHMAINILFSNSFLSGEHWLIATKQKIHLENGFQIRTYGVKIHIFLKNIYIDILQIGTPLLVVPKKDSTPRKDFKS